MMDPVFIKGGPEHGMEIGGSRGSTLTLRDYSYYVINIMNRHDTEWNNLPLRERFFRALQWRDVR